MSATDELHDRYHQLMLGKANDERIRQQELEANADTTRSSGPAGRRALRGFPVVGMGGLGMRQDPLRYLIDVERDSRNAE